MNEKKKNLPEPTFLKKWAGTNAFYTAPKSLNACCELSEPSRHGLVFWSKLHVWRVLTEAWHISSELRHTRGCSKSGRSKREEVKHSFYTAFTHTDRCCLLWSIFSQSTPIWGPLSGKPLRTCCLSYAQWHRTVEPCIQRASNERGEGLLEFIQTNSTRRWNR